VVVVLATLVVAGLGGAAWLLGRRAAVPVARPTAVTKATPTPARSTPAPSASPSREAGAPRPSATTRPAALHVEADVADASVFLDRRFVGKAPVDLTDVTPGPHRLNVSADGHAMHAEEVEIGAEPRSISVRFNEIRLAESLAVIHKHTLGSCQGTLTASPQGLGFAATNGKDSFRVAFADLTKLDVDYLGKTLRVALRGGRSYTFTVEGASADPLLVFQQKVEEVLKRL
jgi:hypothetical protein